MHYLPLTPGLFSILVFLVVGLIILIQLRILRYAYMKLGVSPGMALILLFGSLVGSFVVGFLYNFGQAMFPELAYVVLFLPMLIVLVVRPQGLFGRPAV